ncbi:MAG: hypothetical protein OEZ15_05300 [Gammaproteobacteria bacterium]|nr:hypothetical protein [Gammaproteobacteria bacterium]
MRQRCSFKIFSIEVISQVVLLVLMPLYPTALYAETVDLVHDAAVGVDVEKSHSEDAKQEWRLTEEQWDLLKQGEQLLQMPMMREIVGQWESLRSSEQKCAIELLYPGGEEGELWVEELKDSLISLSIPSQYLYVVPGSGEADIIIFKIFIVGDV